MITGRERKFLEVLKDTLGKSIADMPTTKETAKLAGINPQTAQKLVSRLVRAGLVEQGMNERCARCNRVTEQGLEALKETHK